MKRSHKTASASNQPRRTTAEQPVASIRETERAHALLQDQLHRLYWWVFNACRIKGFLRAKQLDEIEVGSDELSQGQPTATRGPVESIDYPPTELK